MQCALGGGLGVVLAASRQIQLGQHHLRLTHPGVVAHGAFQHASGHVQVYQRLVLLDDGPVQRRGRRLVGSGQVLRAVCKHGRHGQHILQARVLQCLRQPVDLVHHAPRRPHGPGPERSGPVRLLVAVLHLGEAREDVVLPAEPLLDGVRHAHDDEGRHLVGREHMVLPILLQYQAAVGLQRVGQHLLHKLRARLGAEQVDQVLGRLARNLAHPGALLGGVELHQVHKRVAIHAVQQPQQAHIARLLPHRERTRHAHQVVPERAGLVPVLPHIARQHGGQHGGKVWVAGQPFVVQQRLCAGKQVGVQRMQGQVHGGCLRGIATKAYGDAMYTQYCAVAAATGLRPYARRPDRPTCPQPPPAAAAPAARAACWCVPHRRGPRRWKDSRPSR